MREKFDIEFIVYEGKLKCQIIANFSNMHSQIGKLNVWKLFLKIYINNKLCFCFQENIFCQLDGVKTNYTILKGKKSKQKW